MRLRTSKKTTKKKRKLSQMVHSARQTCRAVDVLGIGRSMNLGVTGGIASGKSTVMQMLQRLGAVTIDADEIGRRLTAPGSPLSVQIIELLGRDYAEKENPSAIARANVGNAIFRDTMLRAKLEMLTHPPILEEVRRRMAFANAENPFAIVAIEMPLLYEAGLEAMFDSVAVVWCSEAVQLARLKARLPDLPDEALEQRIHSQWPLEQKRSRATYLINSEKPMDEMAADLARLYSKIRSSDP